jgi:predicted small lipoprotein YifL
VIQPSLRKLLGASCLALLVLALSGCGRRGPPELPPDAATPAETQTSSAPGTAPQSAGVPATQTQTAIGTPPVGPSLDATMTQNPAATNAVGPKASAPVYSSFPLDPLLK